MERNAGRNALASTSVAEITPLNAPRAVRSDGQPYLDRSRFHGQAPTTTFPITEDPSCTQTGGGPFSHSRSSTTPWPLSEKIRCGACRTGEDFARVLQEGPGNPGEISLDVPTTCCRRWS